MHTKYAETILDSTRKNYNLIAGEFSRTRRNLWPELSFLKEYVENNDKILDLGCGNGRLIELFNNMDVEYVGVDSSEKLIEEAKKGFQVSHLRQDFGGQASFKFQREFIVADGLSLPFEKESFDKIFSVAVLHHIPSRQLRLKFLSEARRVLRKNGVMIFTVWNLWQWRYFWKHLKFFSLKIFGISRLDFNDLMIDFNGAPRYYHVFTKKSLKKIFLEAGFKIEKAGDLSRNEKKLNYYIIARK